MPDRTLKVAVAMSGGVDSSVAAALLRREGHDVFGVTVRLWRCDEGAEAGRGGRTCCGVDDLEQARAAAGLIGIPHYVIDCRSEFDAMVLEPVWREYARGRTPNPCVLCNERIKFGRLLDRAAELGADRIATGHYARIRRDAEGGAVALLRGVDPGKDQSYFLFALSDAQLAGTLTPLGDLTKEAVRELARELGLPNAERRESQDACLLVGGDGFAESLRQRFDGEPRPGSLVDPEGRHLGDHQGVHTFTIGQRRRLGIALGRRAYVLAIRADAGEVVVGSDERALFSRGLVASGVRWIGRTDPAGPVRCEVKIRYRHRAARAVVEPDGEDEDPTAVRVRFDEPQRAVTPGQAAVFYDGDLVLGGGWIDRVVEE